MIDPDVAPLTNVEDPTDLPKISVTELGNLLRCTKKHDYAYRQGLTKADPPSFLTKGKYLHSLMQHWLSHHSALSTFDAANDSIMEVTSTMETPIPEADKTQLDRQFRDYVAEVDMEDVGIIEVEREFLVDVGLHQAGGIPVMVHGIFDAVIEADGYWLVEHKTAGRAWSQGQFAWDYQSRIYHAAMRALGYDEVVGTIWNFFYPKRWDRITTYADQSEEQAFLGEVQQALRLRDSGIILRQPHWGCNDCWFRDLCHAELLGTEDGYIRENQYIVDENKTARFEED